MKVLVSRLKEFIGLNKPQDIRVKLETVLDEYSVFCRTNNFEFHYMRPHYIESIGKDYGYIKIKILTEEYEKKFQVGDGVGSVIPTPTYDRDDFSKEVSEIRDICNKKSQTMYLDLDEIISKITKSHHSIENHGKTKKSC